MKKPLFTKTIQLMIWLMLMIAVIGLVLGHRLMLYYFEKEKEDITNGIRQYFELNDNSFRQLNQELLFIAANDANVKGLTSMENVQEPDYKALLNYNIDVAGVQMRLQNIVSVYGNKYYVWLYEAKSDTFIDYGNNDYKLRTDFREIIGKQIEEKNIKLSQNGRWFIEEQRYICSTLRFGNVYIGTWIDLEDYLDNIMKLKISPSFMVSILDQDENPVRNKRYLYGDITDIDDMESGEKGLSNFTIKEKGAKSDFSIVIRIYQKWYENSHFLQMVLVLVSLGFLLVVLSFSVYLRNKVLHPILRFYNQIAANSGIQKINVNEGVVELDEAARMLNVLIDEVHALELDNYVQKTKRQEAELGFAQQQIRPHFFINCLNVIYSMAQLNKKQNIQDLCVDISDYMRLLFQANTDLVPVLQELDMIDKYLKVMNSVYGQDFMYSLTKECELAGDIMPPLLIQTFVENSIKHGGKEERLFISVVIKKECSVNTNKLCISIQDSGIGFPEEVLEKLNRGEEIQKTAGHQIGIQNVLQRLKLIYETDYELLFQNLGSGAKVTIRIPERKAEAVKDEYTVG
ncbi:sensor histidine kinase [Eisenbergiella tayi]|uniref:sensor histidine kinase n=1 Tax=Eisenbergiella tayi TaxID=1432052 RepID=UPI0022E8071B|nr:histidine kinase [Eisenbergiella tayi]